MAADSSIDLGDIIGSDFYDLVPLVLEEDPHIKHLWLSGGRGSLKSSFASIAVLLRLLSFPTTHAVCFRKFTSHLRDSVFNQILWAAEKLKILDKLTIRKSPLQIILATTGQSIYFKGLDEPSKIKSFRPPFGSVSTVWFEELEEYEGIEELRSVFQSLARGEDSKILSIYSFNPPQTVYSWVNKEAQTYSPNRIIHKSSYLNAPAQWLGKDFILEAESLKKTNEFAYRHEYLGEVTGTGGAIFNNIVDREITDKEIDSFGYVYQGLDWGFATDPLAFIKCSYDRHTRRLFIFDEIYGTHILTTRLSELLIEHGAQTRPIIADCADPQSINELYSRGFYIYGARKPKNSIAFGIKFLQDLVEIVIDKRRCPNAFREFVLYEYEKDKNGEFKPVYPDKNNHCLEEGTLIDTSKGKIPIENVKAGDFVLTRKGYKKVIWSGVTRKNVDVYKLKTQNGRSLTGTYDHPVLVGKYFRNLISVRYGDELCIDDKSSDKAISILHNGRAEVVYDLTVEGEHEFFANGILVHNCIDSTRYSLSDIFL